MSQMDGRTDNLRLLDPFAGCGTAPLVARSLGATGIGYEPHPFFARIAEAKTNSARYWPDLPGIRAALAQGLLSGSPRDSNLSESAALFLNKLFEPEVLATLLSARRALEGGGFGQHPLAFLILSRMLDHCCLAATDGIYKAPTSTKKALTPKAALDCVFTSLEEDEDPALIPTAASQIHSLSSEAMPEVESDSVDLVVTSPPYLNNFDFAEMTRMYLYFWGMAASWADITDKVRSKLIVNTTTALKGHRDRQHAYQASLPETIAAEVARAVSTLAGKKGQKAGKKEYDLLVYPYLSQMQSVLRESARVLKPGAAFHMMVSDAALYGVHLPTPNWLASIMEANGFYGVECAMVRPRGHRWILDKREGTATGLGEYHVFGRAS